MNAEDIVQILNNSIKETRKIKKIESNSHLVLLVTIDSNRPFKVYKTYKYTLYFINNKHKYKVFSSSLTAKVLKGQEDKMKKDIDTKFMYSLFDFLQTEYYNLIINGEYKGGADE